MELWTRCKQNSLSLNEWITKVYNLVEICGYDDSKDRIMRDDTNEGCTNKGNKDKIIQKGEKVSTEQVISILQMEHSTSRNKL